MNYPSARSSYWLPYRLMRRYAVANVSYLYSANTEALAEMGVPAGYHISPCPSKRLVENADALECKFSRQDIDGLDCGRLRCFGAFHNEALVAFAWVAFADVEASANHDGKPETGLPIQLADDVAFVFNVLVLPDHRGCRLYAALITQMAQTLSAQGVRRFVLATEGTNTNALRAVERMGFKKVAHTSFFKLGPLCKATYPKLPHDCGFTIGAYAGDLRAAKSNLA